MDNRDAGTQHKLRMPPELKEKLFTSAKEMNRSLNAEIVARLQKSFEEDKLEEKLGHQEIVAQVVQDFTDKFLEQLEKHRQSNKP